MAGRFPYSDIEEILETKLLNIHPITIVLRGASRFGSRIVYMPYAHLAFWKDHPTAVLLRAKAGLSA
jgi:hypothetical protein